MTTTHGFLRDYSPPAQLFHWGSALLVLFAWALGSFGDDLPKGSIRNLGEFVHVSAGQLILILLLARLAWRAISPPPPPETTPLGKWADRGGVAMHYVLYALLVAAPVAGVVTLFANGESLPLFGLGEIPSPWLKDKAFAHDVKEIHETLANALIILALAHAGAALAHHFYFHDRTLKRMLPNIFDANV
ncbi:cytochrome b [Methylocystis parvus]|uniref:Cytochrome b n=1 Tax=Methylocystis parvus TaxID=134 RepID=A0A6B8M7K0_9HYPH|nr:cytochrome b/b6 domain-containing protein [Methylocystis parvus]QGM97303.1 cytochrome b [Methylocystis parvus]WBJ98786.1 cytochrome b/b6 domain-containing protein [Methylocystis parvus OBBP]